VEVTGSIPVQPTIFPIPTGFFDIGMTQNCATCASAQAYIIYYESLGGQSRHTRLCQECAARLGFDALKKGGLEGVKALDVEITPEHLSAARLAGHKERLSQAIKDENYEEAARLRDLINVETILAPLR
jgi:protein-arginine kinase activator protein McsA